MKENALMAAVLIICGCIDIARTPSAGRTETTVTPATEVTTTPRTEPPQDATGGAVPSSTDEATPADYLHSFVPSVDSPLLCHVCGESDRGGNHGSVAQPAISNVGKSHISAVTPPPASPPTRNAAAATGQWITVQRPIYGRFGRFQGYQHVRQWQPFKGKWVATPHHTDGYWVECTAQQMAEKTGIKSWAGHPFSQYRWEWSGITDADKTWIDESPPGKLPQNPKAWVWVPDNDPFAPGQRKNL